MASPISLDPNFVHHTHMLAATWCKSPKPKRD